MADRDLPSGRADEPEASEELVLCWRNPDGSTDRARALRRENAEQVARIFSRMYPDQTYWLEPLKAAPPGAYTGLRRRRVR
jgi:hypothetical protein